VRARDAGWALRAALAEPGSRPFGDHKSIGAGRMSGKARSSKPRDITSALQLARALNRYSNTNTAEGYVLALTELPHTVARLVVDILYPTVTKATARRRWPAGNPI
jgi:hypothetical protein